MATIAVSRPEPARRARRSALETTVLAILAAMVVIWIVFQIAAIQSPFPPIGILYALGSVIVGGVLIRVQKPWTPAVASAWALLMMVPESLPAIEHMLDWSELYSHFDHYLLIMTFFPLAALLAVAGIAATRQNRSLAVTGADAPAPSWLRTAVASVVAFIVVANLVTIALYAFEMV